MINTNVTNFRKQIFELIDQTVKYNEPINISTKSGNAVLISEEDYNNLVETMYLNSIPGMSEKGYALDKEHENEVSKQSIPTDE